MLMSAALRALAPFSLVAGQPIFQMLQRAAGDLSEADYADWLRAHLHARE